MKAELMASLTQTGKYVYTGKVLIGLAYTPSLRGLDREEELIQSIVLGTFTPPLSLGWVSYLVSLLGLFAILMMVSCKGIL